MFEGSDMPAATRSVKTSRMDLRMTDEQKRQIELAASMSGMSTSQWSISRLMESARREIVEHRSLLVTDEAFDALATALEGPQDATFATFSQGKTRWD